MSEQGHKLGIIIPYRNRYLHLIEFKRCIQKYLQDKKIEYELIVVEQDDAKTFNRGKLLNVGFTIAKKLNCDYVVFHDIDMLPCDVDYSYSDIPLHLATNFKKSLMKSKYPVPDRVVFDEYFGGVTMFPSDIFEEINGYSNDYWGWGYEDNDLLHRCKMYGINLDQKEINMMGGNSAAIKFNGASSHVKCKNIIDLSKPLTLFVTFYPDDILCDHLKYDDTYSVFGIPGFDFLISYNSYKRYNFEIYDNEKNIIYINSDIKTNYKTNICVTIDPIKKQIVMYQDGVVIGTKYYKNELYDYENSQENMYLGVCNPLDMKNPKFYRGLLQSFAVFGKNLSEAEVKEISNNQFFGLTHNFGEYISSDSLQLYYDAKFIRDNRLIDLSGNKNDGEMIDYEIVGYSFENKKVLQIPHRRNSTFILLSHEENGYVNNGWKDQTTRYNQLRFHNEVSRGLKNPKKDGLSNCDFRILTHAKVDNDTHVVVKI